MKKLIVLIAGCVFACNVMAQDTKSDNKSSTAHKSSTSTKHAEYCASMKDGKLMVHHGSKHLANDTTLSNGITIKTDGTVMKKDGTQLTLKNGECIDQNGTVMASHHNKKKNTATKETKESK